MQAFVLHLSTFDLRSDCDYADATADVDFIIGQMINHGVEPGVHVVESFTGATATVHFVKC